MSQVHIRSLGIFVHPPSLSSSFLLLSYTFSLSHSFLADKKQYPCTQCIVLGALSQMGSFLLSELLVQKWLVYYNDSYISECSTYQTFS